MPDNQRLIAEGLFEASETDAPNLLGSRCSNCDEVVFPGTSDCPNCQSHNTMRPFRLVGRGELMDFVIVHRGPTGFRVPYIQAYVKLDDGPVIFTKLEHIAPEEEQIHLGMKVVMGIEVIKVINGIEYIGWIFRPESGRA